MLTTLKSKKLLGLLLLISDTIPLKSDRSRPLASLQQDHVFNVVGMRKHIHRLHTGNAVAYIQQLQITRLGGRVTAHIYDLIGSRIQDGLYHIGMHSGTRRIGNDDIAATVLLKQLGSKQVV